jgi:hypothetical protein
MAYGITRVNGGALPTTEAQARTQGTFHGGYQIRWFEVADTGYDTTPGIVDSNFEKAVRAIQNLATIVVLGVPGSAGFIVGVDGGSYYGRGDNTGYAANESAADLEAAIEAAVPTCTVTEKYLGGGTGLVFTTVS